MSFDSPVLVGEQLGHVAQLEEYFPVTEEVAGASPVMVVLGSWCSQEHRRLKPSRSRCKPVRTYRVVEQQ